MLAADMMVIKTVGAEEEPAAASLAPAATAAAPAPAEDHETL